MEWASPPRKPSARTKDLFIVSNYIGLGTNLPLANQRSGVEILTDALVALGQRGLAIGAVSGFYRSEPVPVSDQNWYVNAVAEFDTSLSPEGVLAILHEVEALFGRTRTRPNAARTLDLDLLAFGDLVRVPSGSAPHVPHPRMHGRAFVLLPLADIAPRWCHPVTGASLSTLIDHLPAGQRIEPLEVSYRDL